MQVAEKRVAACETGVFSTTRYDIELCHGKSRDRLPPSNDNRQQQISFRREQCNGERGSNASITHNETQALTRSLKALKRI